MEIRPITNSGDAGSTLTQDVDKGQKSDAFSELLAMLFSNMLIPDSNQYSLDMKQDNTTDLNNSPGNNTGLNNMLSIIDSLKISGVQSKDAKSVESLINNSSLLTSILSGNSDFQKLFNLSGNVPAELQEFIDNINVLGSKESESIGTKLSNDSVNIIPEQLNKNVATSEVKAMSDILNILTEENPTVSGLKTISDILNIRTRENAAVAEPKRISDLLNLLPTTFKTQTSSTEVAKVPNDSTDINYIKNVKGIKGVVDVSADGSNNSANTQGEVKSIKPQEKLSAASDVPDNFQQATGLNNINNSTSPSKIPETALIERPQDIIDVTVEKFKTLKLPGSTEVTVKLRPEELGDVSLKLVLEKGQINGSITAERKEVVLMLQNNLDQLKTDLKNSNVNLNNITVNTQAGEDFDRNNSQRWFGNKQNRNNHKLVQAFEEEIQSYDSLEGLNIIA